MHYKLTKYESHIDSNQAFDDRHHSMYCCTGYFNAFHTEWPVFGVEMNDSSVYYSVGEKRINVLGTLCQYTDEEIERFSTFFSNSIPADM